MASIFITSLGNHITRGRRKAHIEDAGGDLGVAFFFSLK
jgi:hypothetical protein